MRAPLLAIVLCLTSLLVLPPKAAQADDELSEHTAQLYGDFKDTLGVSLSFDKKAGWGMSFRPKPGADALEIALPFLPADHAHYAVVVGPKRHWLAFITQSRSDIDLKTGAIWTMNSKGKVVKHWTFADVMNAGELAGLKRSISHTMWLETPPIAKAHRIELRLTTHRIVVDPLTSKLSRVPARP